MRSKIRACEKHSLNTITEDPDKRLNVLQGDLALFLENGQHIILAGRRGNIPLFDITDAFRMLHPWSRNKGYVTKCGARHGHGHC